MRNNNNILIIFLTGILGAVADGWSLFLCAVIGIMIAVIAFRKFFFVRTKGNIFVLSVAIGFQYIVHLLLNLSFMQERIAFLISPLIFLYAMKIVTESKHRIILEHKLRMFLERTV